MNWSGIANGEPLRRAAEAGLDALITTDRGMEYEQDLASLPIAVVVLLPRVNTIEGIRRLLPRLFVELAQLQARQFVKIAEP